MLDTIYLALKVFGVIAPPFACYYFYRVMRDSDESLSELFNKIGTLQEAHWEQNQKRIADLEERIAELEKKQK